MRRSSIFISSLAVALAGFFTMAPSASARVDTRPCVSKAEFRSVHAGMTEAQVAQVFDIWGHIENVTQNSLGYDTYRSYKKCRGFGRKHSRVGIDFDDYSYSFQGSGWRAYDIRRNNPWK